MTRTRFQPGRRSTVVLMTVGLLAVGSLVGVTTAAFTSANHATASVSGSIDIAQSADGSVQADTPVTAQTLPVQGIVTALAAPPVGAPTMHGAVFGTEVFNLSPEVAVATNVMISDTAAAGEDSPFEHLLFGVYVDGKPIGDGTPLTADQLAAKNAAGGIELGTSIATGAKSNISVHVWLASDAPAQSYGKTATIQLEIIGEAVGGEQFTLKGVWS